MTIPKMISARTYFARMNENRSRWVDESTLKNGCEVFFKSNGYTNIEYDRVFQSGQKNFISPICAKNSNAPEDTLVTLFKPSITNYDLKFFNHIELTLYDILDNYIDTGLLLATDSLSYDAITKLDDLGTAVENLMREGLYIIFINHRNAYAMFDNYAKLTMPIHIDQVFP